MRGTKKETQPCREIGDLKGHTHARPEMASMAAKSEDQEWAPYIGHHNLFETPIRQIVQDDAFPRPCRAGFWLINVTINERGMQNR